LYRVRVASKAMPASYVSAANHKEAL